MLILSGYEIIMLAQEANEALPSRYCCRCAKLAQEANEALHPDIVIVDAAVLIMLTQEANEALPSR